MLNQPLFGTASTNTAPTAGVLSGGWLPNVVFPAENANYLFNAASQGNVELANAISATGQTPTSADLFQLIKTMIAVSHPVGELINTEIPLTPAIWTSGSATYVPVIKRWDADHDVTSTQAPDLVTAYRAATASINVAGTPTSTWTGTVTGTNLLTLTGGTASIALVTLLSNEAIANGYIATQTVGAAALFTGTAQRCLTLNGTEYPITNVNIGALTVSLGGSPPNATYTNTVQLFPYRIAGSSTSVRLPRLSGFVGVSQFDYDGVFVAGFRKMDQMQGHYHDVILRASTNTGSPGYITVSNSGVSTSGNPGIGSPITDGANGTPRVGKTTQPQTYSLYPHTWAGRLLA